MRDILLKRRQSSHPSGGLSHRQVLLLDGRMNASFKAECELPLLNGQVLENRVE
jgi:hypothetical protein